MEVEEKENENQNGSETESQWKRKILSEVGAKGTIRCGLRVPARGPVGDLSTSPSVR